ncbi:hypothetical protein PIB30_080159 [Stylosanthes scabra]|uniref:Uncharacterized protein n=1 Tax=Stylosanthes scabra TaxID=79078 RepID=A0ABU6ZQ51_9FABA|nr:hypothetical protein [Stylosanthes scabra]
MAACKPLAELRRSWGIAITQIWGSKSFSSNSRLRSFSQLGSKAEGQGVPTKTQVQSSQGHPLDLLHNDLELQKLHHDLDKRINEYHELMKPRTAMKDRELSDRMKAARRNLKFWIGTYTSVYVVVGAAYLIDELKKPGGIPI